MFGWFKSCLGGSCSSENRNHRHFRGRAIVDTPISPCQRGQVRYRAGWWFAQCEEEICFIPGDVVEVVGIRGIVLIIKPALSA